jgi:hypothetical protein
MEGFEVTEIATEMNLPVAMIIRKLAGIRGLRMLCRFRPEVQMVSLRSPGLTCHTLQRIAGELCHTGCLPGQRDV